MANSILVPLTDLSQVNLDNSRDSNDQKPFITDSGCYTPAGYRWLFQADGPFPFADCIDRTSKQATRARIEANQRYHEKMVAAIISQYGKFGGGQC